MKTILIPKNTLHQPFRSVLIAVFTLAFVGAGAAMLLLATGCQKLAEERVALAGLPPGIDASGFIRNDVGWPDVYEDPQKIDYEITMNAVIEDNVMVRIAPGVIIKFTGTNSGITVSNGALVAVGTEAKPICLDGSVESRGSWLGIRFNTDNPANEMQHCKVRWGGSDGFGAVQVRGALGGIYRSFCKITFCEIANSSNYGLYTDKNADIVFAENALTNNGNAPARITTLQLGKLDAASNYSNNAFGHIEVAGEGDIDSSSIDVPKLIVPYMVQSGSINIGAGNLTILPGVEMRFKPNTRIVVLVAGGGTLTAIGEPGNRITFRGVQAGRGGWDGIAIFGASIANRFEYCTIDGGGQTPMGALTQGGAGRANIVVGNTQINFPAAYFENCTIGNSAGYGIWVGGNSASGINGGTLNPDILEPALNNLFPNNASANIGPF